MCCQVLAAGDEVVVEIRNIARLREGFDLAQVPGGVSGLGLVRALLPRRSSALSIGQQGEHVLARVVLRPPSVRQRARSADCYGCRRIMPRSSNFQAGRRVIVANKGRILVVDDDRLVLATVTHGLTQAGYEVIDADNGDDAILLARQQRPELALLDIRMEGKSGFDVAEVPARRLPHPVHVPVGLFRRRHHGAGARRWAPWPTWSSRSTWARSCPPSKPPSSACVPAPCRWCRPRWRPTTRRPLRPRRAADVLADAVPLAVGVLMHKHALTRVAAHAMLRQRAQEEGLSELAKAQRLLAALEELARS